MHRVTDAKPSLSEDIGKREKSYFIKMGIRLICLVLAFTVPAPLPVRLLLFAGAIFLPYVAVIGANAPKRGHPMALTWKIPDKARFHATDARSGRD